MNRGTKCDEKGKLDAWEAMKDEMNGDLINGKVRKVRKTGEKLQVGMDYKMEEKGKTGK